MPTTIRTIARRTAPPKVAADAPATVHRFTVAQYHSLIEAGVLGEDDRCELIHGWIVDLMPPNPPHAKATNRVSRAVSPFFPGAGWFVGVQNPITVGEDEPLPDLYVAIGPDDRYDTRHPTPRDIALLVEVADSSLEYDTSVKLTMYAGAKIPVYWVVNLRDRRVEVYTSPRGGRTPTYRTRAVYAPGAAVPVVVGGRQAGTIAVNELLP